MPEKEIETADASKDTATVTPPEKEKETTLEEALKDDKPEEKKSDTVPLSKYMDEKNENKNLKKSLADAQAAIEALQTKPNQSIAPSDIAAIAKKHNVDENLLSDLATVLESRARESVAQEFAPKLKEIEDSKNADKFEKTFEKLWTGALGENPEYENVASKEAIKALSMLPQNQKLTMSQLLEQTYGQAVNKGKKTLETARPNAGKTPDNINFANPSTEEWEMIKSNPELKKQYNEHLIKNIRL